MFTLVDNLRELLKSYTIAANVANATQSERDRSKAEALLTEINSVRLTLAINAEMREIFYLQEDIVGAASVNTSQDIWVSKNDIAYTIKRGIANLLAGTTLSLLNQGNKYRQITRNATNWQQLFADIQRAVPRGQQTLFDLPERLIFGENQALGLKITGQNATGNIFFHGATIKDNLTEAAIEDLRREFIDESGRTRYLPETQLVPIQFKFASNVAGSPATSPNGSSDIFSVKSDRSVLLLDVSTTATLSRMSISDEGRNQQIADTVEAAGIAADYTNPFTTFYPLPEPHLLRKGGRLKLKAINGSLITGTQQAINTINTLTFRGITL